MKVLYISEEILPDGKLYGSPRSLLGMVYKLKKEHAVDPVVLTMKQGAINNYCIENEIENYEAGYNSAYYWRSNNKIRRFAKIIIKLPIYYIRHRRSNAGAIKSIEKVVDIKSFDIMHTNLNRIDFGDELAKKYNKPHVWHLREFGDLDYSVYPISRNYFNRFNRSNVYPIAISKIVKSEYVKKGVDSEKITVIYNGVNTEEIILKNNWQKKYGEKLKIVFSGSILKSKGQMQILQALSIFSNMERQRVELDIYGTGPSDYVRSLQDFVIRNKLQVCVNFKGYCDHLTKILYKYDIGIMASKAEAFGRTTVEYMSAGLCTIASRSGANSELIEDRTSGYLYNPESSEELADILRYLLNNEHVLEKIGKNAIKKVNQFFTSSHNAAEVYDLYKNILKAKK